MIDKKPECIETKQSSTSAVLNFLKSTTGRHLSLLQIRWAHQTLACHAVCINGLGRYGKDTLHTQSYLPYSLLPHWNGSSRPVFRWSKLLCFTHFLTLDSFTVSSAVRELLCILAGTFAAFRGARLACDSVIHIADPAQCWNNFDRFTKRLTRFFRILLASLAQALCSALHCAGFWAIVC